MISSLTNHLWQSTAFAGGVALLTLAFRNNRAAVRYWLWLCASLKFLVPFSLLMVVGDRLRHVLTSAPLVQQIAASAVSRTVVQITRPFSETFDFAPAVARQSVNWIITALVVVWFCGFMGVSLMRLRGWLHIRAALRSSEPMNGKAVIPIRMTTKRIEPGVVGFIRPVLLLPEGIAERLAPAQFEAVLAHEQCHVRRRDNLTSAIHMLVEAIFWFHPLVWWIGAKLLVERERACDEEVLRLGNQPRDYAEGILNVCRSYLESPIHCVSGVTGADLKKRISAILAEGFVSKLNFRRKAVLAVAGLVALTGPMLLGAINGGAPQGQDTTMFGPDFKYDVVSIRVSKLAKGGWSGGDVPDGLIQQNITMMQLFQEAYSLGPPLRQEQISGVPSWFYSERYNVSAKTDDSVAAKLQKLSRAQQFLARQHMLQELLLDRFKLRVHRETRPLPVYFLVVRKDGPKLNRAKPGETYTYPMNGGETRTVARALSLRQPGEAEFHMEPISALTQFLGRRLGRTVIDKTALVGDYNFTLHWAPAADEMQNMLGATFPPSLNSAEALPNSQSPLTASDPTGVPDLRKAVEKELGLELESGKGPVEIIVIEYVERPSGN